MGGFGVAASGFSGYSEGAAVSPSRGRVPIEGDWNRRPGPGERGSRIGGAGKIVSKDGKRWNGHRFGFLRLMEAALRQDQTSRPKKCAFGVAPGGSVSAEFNNLYKVQQSDSEIARLQQALDGLDTGAELESQVRQLETELAELGAQLRASEKENLACELELKTLEEKRTRFRAQLYGGTVRNPRQLTDLHQEVEMLEREIHKLEDRTLELMEQMEAQRSKIASGEARLGELKGQLETVRAKYNSVSERLRAEVGELEAKRREDAAQVGVHLLKRYEQIRARTGNLALVKVSGKNCPGCRIALPSETVKGIQAHKTGLTCENCGRLLFWDEIEETEE